VTRASVDGILTVAAQARSIAGLVIDGAAPDIEAIERLGFPTFSRGLAIGDCTKKETFALNCPIEFGGVCVRPCDLVFGATDGLVITGRDCADIVRLSALKTRENKWIMIENLRKGKTTPELAGLGGAE